MKWDKTNQNNTSQAELYRSNTSQPEETQVKNNKNSKSGENTN